MKSRDIGLLVGGLIVGALIGALVMMNLRPDQSAEITALQTQIAVLPTPVFRTVNEAAAVSDFYIGTFDTTEAWLKDALKLELPEAVTKSLASVPTTITDDITLADALKDDKSDTTTLLKYIYDQLLPKRAEGSTSPISTCLALENDIYAGGTVLYIYLQVPTVDAKAMSIPKDWKFLDAPLPQSETWISNCYVPPVTTP